MFKNRAELPLNHLGPKGRIMIQMEKRPQTIGDPCSFAVDIQSWMGWSLLSSIAPPREKVE